MNKLYENMNIVKGVRKYEDYSVHFSLIDDVLNESENVEDDINPVVDKIYADVLSVWLKYAENYTYNEIEETDYIYSGYNFIPEVLEEWRRQNPEKKLRGKRPPVVFLCNNPNIYFPIYYRLLDDENSMEMDASISRKVYLTDSNMKKCMEVDITDKRVLIDLNIKFICNTYMNMDNVYRLKNTIAHELQHSFDSYVIKDKDFSLLRKNSIYYDFRTSEWVNDYFSDSELRKIDMLLYLMSPNECRARNKAVETCLKLIANDESVKEELMKCAEEYGTERKLTRRVLISFVLRLGLVREESLLRKCYESVYGVLCGNGYDNWKVVVLLGYFMQRHKMLSYDRGQSVYKSKWVSEFFRKDNIEKFLESENKSYEMEHYDYIYYMIDLVKNSLEGIYLDYEKKIYNECDKVLDKLFKLELLKEREIFDDDVSHSKIVNRVGLDKDEM